MSNAKLKIEIKPNLLRDYLLEVILSTSAPPPSNPCLPRLATAMLRIGSKKSRERERPRERERDQERERGREREGERERERDRVEIDSERERGRDREIERERDRYRGSDREIEREEQFSADFSSLPFTFYFSAIPRFPLKISQK